MEYKLVSDFFGGLTELEKSILNDIKKDVELCNTDGLYYRRLIGEIVENAQDFERALKDYLSMNGFAEEEVWNKGSGKLLSKAQEKGLFSNTEIDIIRKIIDYRNWTIHELHIDEKAKDFNYRNQKLAVTKHMLFEAIDVVNDHIEKMQGRSGVANIINNSYNF